MTLRWTSRDLELLPDDNKRYEIVDGELYISKHPHWNHQLVCGQLVISLEVWSRQARTGIAVFAPGLIFSDYDDVVPDVVWISRKRLATALQSDGYLHSAPELVAEVLSQNITHQRRDREIKLKLYSRRGVLEYWIVNWQERYVEVYQRENAELKHVKTLYENDTLHSSILPGFTCQIDQIFDDVLS